MASLFQIGGKWQIEVHRRGRIRLGPNKTAATLIHGHVQVLEGALKYGVPPGPGTLAWLQEIDSALRSRLEILGLIQPSAVVTLSALCDRYMQSLGGKPSTAKSRRQTVDALLRYFHPDTAVNQIKVADAHAFRTWMVSKGRKCRAASEDRPLPPGQKPPERSLAQATVSRRIKQCRTIFDIAVSSKQITSNPFAEVKAGKQSNPARQFFVPRDVCLRVAEEIPHAEGRLVFVLARWGGLRVPSEVLDLRWDGVDWSKRRLSFRVPKTEHHEGKETRTCPLFPEIVPHLELAWDRANPGEVWVCPWLRALKGPGSVITNMIVDALKRLGVKRWPKLLTNLRATRATEIEDLFGAKAESEWIGHGVSVAMRHYLMVTDEKWKMACKMPSAELEIHRPETVPVGTDAETF